MEPATNWIFASECDVPAEVFETFVQGEQAYAAYRTIRDVAVITNKRLIVRDAQGLTGRKIEVYSLPWRSVDMWSSENSGTFDLTSELEFWTKAGHIKINLKAGVDVRKLDHLISTFILG